MYNNWEDSSNSYEGCIEFTPPSCDEEGFVANMEWSDRNCYMPWTDID